jgi:hypothetical protein
MEETQHSQTPKIQIDVLAGALRGVCCFALQRQCGLWLWFTALQMHDKGFADITRL